MTDYVVPFDRHSGLRFDTEIFFCGIFLQRRRLGRNIVCLDLDQV